MKPRLLAEGCATRLAGPLLFLRRTVDVGLNEAVEVRGADGRIIQEASKVLVVVLPGADAAAARARLRPVEDAWKARFRQQSVLTVYRSACVAF